MSVTIHLPWPDRALSPNARGHWTKKSRATSDAKSLAYYITYDQKGGLALSRYDGPIQAVITFSPPDRRRRDRDNMIASFKAYQDGIALATGADDSRWVPTYHVADPVKGGEVIVTLSEMPDRAAPTAYGVRG